MSTFVMKVLKVVLRFCGIANLSSPQNHRKWTRWWASLPNENMRPKTTSAKAATSALLMRCPQSSASSVGDTRYAAPQTTSIMPGFRKPLMMASHFIVSFDLVVATTSADAACRGIAHTRRTTAVEISSRGKLSRSSSGPAVSANAMSAPHTPPVTATAFASIV